MLLLNALDLVHFIMGHHKLVQPKMGGAAGGQGEGTGGSCTGGSCPPPAHHLEPPMLTEVAGKPVSIYCKQVSRRHPDAL